MKYAHVFKKRINCDDSRAVFEYLVDTLKATVTGWDFFVNWAKVLGNIKEVEMDLNLLNYLIGKDDVEHEFELLLEKHPSVARLIPALIASRQSNFEILKDYGRDSFTYENYDFSDEQSISPKKAVAFAKSVGFLALLKSKRLKSIVDYVIGVEVGLDSNGRKNRGGVAMEQIVEFFVQDICRRHNLDYLTEGTSAKVKAQWGLTLAVDKSVRRVDFVVRKKQQLYLIETNFYSGGGSKLKSTAGEYKSMFDWWTKHGYTFIWITDGFGWTKTRQPLLETFEYTDYVLNLEMLAKGLLEDILVELS
ncbi:MAG: type II restriction endonuclease [Deltaproteobacteria bacterium]|nr:type II restriction endonuclease [Deltaproteobacteria bacterium]